MSKTYHIKLLVSDEDDIGIDETIRLIEEQTYPNNKIRVEVTSDSTNPSSSYDIDLIKSQAKAIAHYFDGTNKNAK